MNKLLEDTINQIVDLINNEEAKEFYFYLHKLCKYSVILDGKHFVLTEDIFLNNIVDNLNFANIYYELIDKIKANSPKVEGPIVVPIDNFYDYDSFKIRINVFRNLYSNLNNTIIEYVFSLPHGDLLFNKEVITGILIQDKKLKQIIEFYNK